MRLKTLLEISAERVALLMGGVKEEQVDIINLSIVLIKIILIVKNKMIT